MAWSHCRLDNKFKQLLHFLLLLSPDEAAWKELQDALWSFRTMWLVRYQSSHSLLYPTTLLSTNGSFITFFIKVSWLPAVPFCHCPMEPLTPFSQLIKLSCISCGWYQPTGETPPPHTPSVPSWFQGLRKKNTICIVPTKWTASLWKIHRVWEIGNQLMPQINGA